MNTKMELEKDENFVARPYQDKLLSIALKRNVIIYLPTGAGKTFVALMAMREMGKALEGSLRDGAKRSVFLTNTIALAHQQVDCIRQHTPFKAAVYTGDMNVDAWKRDRWLEEFENAQVIVATCQIVLDVIRHGFMTISQFNLIIFDECHHAQSDHPMHQLMSEFKHCREKEMPRVIGLTGILVTTSSPSQLIPSLDALEATFRGTIATAANTEEFQNVLAYSTKPEENVVVYHLQQTSVALIENISKMVDNIIANVVGKWEADATHLKATKSLKGSKEPNPVKKLRNLWKDFQYQMRDFGVYGASIAILSVLVNLELKKRSAETIVLRNLFRVCITYGEQIRHILVSYMNDADDDESEEEKILSNSSPKLQTFLYCMKKMFNGRKHEDIKCLVFVERRHTAKNLYHILMNFLSSNIPITPEFMVGRNDAMPESIEGVLEVKWSGDVLTKFRRNECNLIVASSVLEEGIDIQSCNTVLVYDQLKSFRSYVQSKGRARMKDSKYTMFVPGEDREKIIQKLQIYRKMDQMLKEYLVGKTIDRTVPLKAEIDKQFETPIEPFFTPIGAKLDAISAPSLLNRYCMCLPNDVFTLATIDWKLVEDDKVTKSLTNNVVASITLPPQSTIKEEVVSDAMENAKWAKRSVAFKACKQLYLNNELNDNLLPINKIKCIEIVNPKYFKHWNDFPSDDRTAGTRKKRRLHAIKFPSPLCEATPKLNTVSYLYTLRVKPDFDCTNETYHIFNLLQSDNYFAILSAKEIPHLAQMLFFLTQGRVICEVDPLPVMINLHTEIELVLLRNFHNMIFRDLLKVCQDFFASNYENDENSYLIVPTVKGKEIDWNLVKNFQNLSVIQNPGEVLRSRAILEPESFLNKVVTTWYTADTDVRYVITKVLYDMTPMSKFPNSHCDTFASYFFDKYQVKTTQPNQFLMEAKGITSKLNRIKPGAGDYGGKKSTKKWDTIILVPELCHNFRFPGDMWQKAVLLPSILHRVHYLLVAEEIRVKLNLHVGLPGAGLYIPVPLAVDTAQRKIEEFKNPTQAAVIPDPNFVEKKQLNKIKTLGQASLYNWKDYEEPNDLDRHINELYPIEIDYYHIFTKNKIIKQPSFLPNNSMGGLANLPAICDVDVDVKSNIEIIKITQQNAKSPEQTEILSAITASSASDVFDMERLEVLGDSFLKFSISLFLIKKHPTWNEGLLTAVKGKFVSNRNLLYCAIKTGLSTVLKVSEFAPQQDWQPPLMSVPLNAKQLLLENNVSPNVLFRLELGEDEIRAGICKDETLQTFSAAFALENSDPDTSMQAFVGKQSINDKSCADSVEAILGSCVKSYGIEKTFSVLEFLGICPPGDDLRYLLNVNLGNPRLRAKVSDRDVDAFLLNYHDLERSLGYVFNDRAYLLQALTHPSYPTNRITGCYQQLEFLGDAILDFLISCFIFERCKDKDPGSITDLRSALVNNVTLAALTIRYKFHLYMLSQNAALSQSIVKFAKLQESHNFKVNDQIRILLAEKDTNSVAMAQYIEVPKALGDIFESLIGAVFLDSKNNLEKTWRVIYRLMSSDIAEFMSNVPIQVVRKLYEFHGANPVFSDSVPDEGDVMVKCRFSCKDGIREVCGFASNKSDAKVAAAKLALQYLEMN